MPVVEDTEAGVRYKFGMDSRTEQAMREVPSDLSEGMRVDHDNFG